MIKGEIMFIIDDKEFHLTEDDEFTFEAIFIVPVYYLLPDGDIWYRIYIFSRLPKNYLTVPNVPCLAFDILSNGCFSVNGL